MRQHENRRDIMSEEEQNQVKGKGKEFDLMSRNDQSMSYLCAPK